MGDLLKTTTAWLGGRRKQCLSQTVVYSRGEAAVDVLATIGRTPFEVMDDYSIVQHWESRDFLIEVEDLADFGRPERGDRITETQDGQTFVYEVMAPGGEPPWRWSGPHRRTLRIHTKQVGET